MNDLATSLLLICAATTFAAALVVAQRRVVASVARRFVRLPRVEQALLVVAVCVMTVCAQKSGTNEVANAENGIFNAEETESQRRGEESLALLRVSPKAEVATNEVFDFSPPDGACLATNWLKRGAVTDFLSIRFDGAFPLDGVDHSRLLASASGEILLFPSRIKLKPFAAPLGILPEAKWNEIFNAEKTSSQFWHKQLDDGTILLTWQNALLNREAANPVSIQAELSPSGDVTYRYDLSRLASDDLLTNVVVAADSLGHDCFNAEIGRDSETRRFCSMGVRCL